MGFAVFYRWATEEGAGGGSAARPTPAVDPDEATVQAEPESKVRTGGRRYSQSPTDPEAATRREAELAEEKRWLQQVAEDPEKFTFFFDKYYDRIFSYAFWRTGNHDRAADIANLTFLVAWERHRQFRWQGYTFGAWLFQIARDQIRNARRRDEARKETAYEPEEHEQADEATPADLHERGQDAALVRICLQRLAPERHELMVLHYFLGLTTREIATIVGQPLGTVHSRLRRSRTAVRKCLEAHGIERGLSAVAMKAVRQAAVEESGLHVVEDADSED